jgi:hypothetical protein
MKVIAEIYGLTLSEITPVFDRETVYESIKWEEND